MLVPQAGPQWDFLETTADVAIYGGAAGGGKTYALLLECLRFHQVKNFGGVVFRRQGVQITNEGGLWDEAMNIFPQFGAVSRQAPKMEFIFPSGAKIGFSHLQHVKDVNNWQGSQIALIAFDELTHFERSQFIYMLSRNRSVCGVRPYIRATTNPDADSWVAGMISWYIDQSTGFPIQERAGRLRYFSLYKNDFVWGDSRQEVADKIGIEPEMVKSFTFIPARLQDNRALMEADPSYLANLMALDDVSRARLLDGNWKVRPSAGLYFKRSKITMVDTVPHTSRRVRSWDLAATPVTPETPNPDATAGVRMSRTEDGKIYVEHVIHTKDSASAVKGLIAAQAHIDGHDCRITVPQDPGQAGKDQAEQFVRSLPQFDVRICRPSRDKILRAQPFAAQWQAGNVYVVKGDWNNAFFDEMESFPPTNNGHDDIVDACSDAYNTLVDESMPVVYSL
jgi:predicted phage terminase large subunit-like protein